mmetsp:Transcript_8362/g.28435  ORF Transcript_8362/g.28435 Transcript_8362/m.28435 type:complete len:343 (+) Transcript_8362:522-1550(+)
MRQVRAEAYFGDRMPSMYCVHAQHLRPAYSFTPRQQHGFEIQAREVLRGNVALAVDARLRAALVDPEQAMWKALQDVAPAVGAKLRGNPNIAHTLYETAEDIFMRILECKPLLLGREADGLTAYDRLALAMRHPRAVADSPAPAPAPAASVETAAGGAGSSGAMPASPPHPAVAPPAAASVGAAAPVLAPELAAPPPPPRAATERERAGTTCAAPAGAGSGPPASGPRLAATTDAAPAGAGPPASAPEAPPPSLIKSEADLMGQICAALRARQLPELALRFVCEDSAKLAVYTPKGVVLRALVFVRGRRVKHCTCRRCSPLSCARLAAERPCPWTPSRPLRR